MKSAWVWLTKDRGLRLRRPPPEWGRPGQAPPQPLIPVQATPLRAVDQMPAENELTKDLRIDLTLGAVLSSTPQVPAAEGDGG